MNAIILTILKTVRERDAMMETVADLNSTILKFREVVQKMTDENTLLRQNLEEESSKSSIPGLVEDLAFKVRYIYFYYRVTIIFL